MKKLKKSNIFAISFFMVAAPNDKRSKDLKNENIRKYSAEYLNFIFIPAPNDNTLPMRLSCQQVLVNELMKRNRLEAHLGQSIFLKQT